MRVLVIDDEPNLAEALCRVLELAKFGPWQAESVSSGEAGLDRLAQTPFDVLVTDLCLPGIDGLQVIRQAKRIRPKARTVLITAYGTPELEARGTELADAYLPKPFSLRLFTEVVKHVVEQNPGNCAQQ